MRLAHHNVVAASVVALLVIAQTKPARADCANDSQCKGDRICEKGQCVTPPPKAAPVTSVPSQPPAAPPPAPPAAVPAAAARQPGSVHVLFEGRSELLVTMESRGVKNGECRMPCSLDLQPGEYSLHAKGYSDQIQVPPSDTTVAFNKACVFCYIGGGIFTGLSIPTIIGGAMLAGEPSSRGAGYGVITGGVVLAASGIALLIIGIAHGGMKVVVKERGEASADDARYATVKSASAANGIGFTF